MILPKNEPLTKEEILRIREHNKQLLGALAMDFKRTALALHRKSFAMADTFFQEAMKRKNEVQTSELLPYMQTMLKQIETLRNQNEEHKAENALMYSTRIQNYLQYKMQPTS